MTQRLALFIDYQNVYKRCRDAFCNPGDWHVEGQIRPLAAGLVIRGGGSDRELVAVHAYRGLPSSKHDPKGYAAAQRQVAAWRNSGGGVVLPHTRPLNYRVPSRPREKGIDVALAVDFVAGFMKREFDVGVIFSDDTDLHPALEAVGDLAGPGHAELATWYDTNRGPRQVMSGGRPVYTHVLGENDYLHIKDHQDYNVKTARKPRPPRRPDPD